MEKIQAQTEDHALAVGSGEEVSGVRSRYCAMFIVFHRTPWEPMKTEPSPSICLSMGAIFWTFRNVTVLGINRKAMGVQYCVQR